LEHDSYNKKDNKTLQSSLSLQSGARALKKSKRRQAWQVAASVVQTARLTLKSIQEVIWKKGFSQSKNFETE